MIHFATVHHHTDVWIDVQLRYLRRYVTAPFQVHACVTGIDAEPHRSKFSTVWPTDKQDHARKLNKIGEHLVATASPSDIIVFIDSDAFPIAPIDRLIAELDSFPLLAVRRDENLGDRQPHPSFCMTTAGFWSDIGGDWGREHGWTTTEGTFVKDVGGNLLKLLDDRRIEWKPLLRTNQVDVHPVLFGIYDDAIYHHAAGSRRPGSRLDRARARSNNPHATDEEYEAVILKVVEENERLSKDILADIIADNDFLSRFRSAAASRQDNN